MLDRVLFDVARHPACFCLSTKDRTAHSLEAVRAIGFVDGFDLLWFDGSRTEEGRRLPHELAPDLACLREIHVDVVGGPDFAIFPALARMVALGYDYCGLIENDVQLGPGWFEAMRALFGKGRDDGLEVGAVAPYAFNRWVLYNRGAYAVTLISGATAVLFTRQAAQLVLDNYRTTTTREISEWMSFVSGKDVGMPREAGAADTRVSSDLSYDLTLQKHGLAILGAIPPRGRLMDGEDLAHANLGGYCLPAPDATVAHEAGSFACFADRLREIGGRTRQQGHGVGAPYVFMPSMGFWYVFAHQILHSRRSPAQLSGRWRFVWEKFDGPFALEACETGAELSFPLYGPLCGLFCAHGPDSGAFELLSGDDRLVDYDCRRDIGETRQFYARLDVEPTGAQPLRLRAIERRGGAPGG
ncbi:MAG: hypothetical protein HY060_19805, partial [Proteobacteria bacterium]|nr:hypothetical protein [Pseudomonadota bacterium]